MKEPREQGGQQAFLALAAIILGALLFAAGVMVGRQLKVSEENNPADVLDRIDQRDERQSLDGGLTFPEELSKPASPPRPPPPPVPSVAVEVKPTVPPPRIAPEPEVKEKTQGASGPMLQVASYRERNQAEDLVTKLKAKGFDSAHQVEGEVAGKGTHYRVRVGPFKDLKSAEEARDKLKRNHGLSAILLGG